MATRRRVRRAPRDEEEEEETYSHRIDADVYEAVLAQVGAETLARFVTPERFVIEKAQRAHLRAFANSEWPERGRHFLGSELLLFAFDVRGLLGKDLFSRVRDNLDDVLHFEFLKVENEAQYKEKYAPGLESLRFGRLELAFAYHFGWPNRRIAPVTRVQLFRAVEPGLELFYARAIARNPGLFSVAGSVLSASDPAYLAELARLDELAGPQFLVPPYAAYEPRRGGGHELLASEGEPRAGKRSLRFRDGFWQEFRSGSWELYSPAAATPQTPSTAMRLLAVSRAVSRPRIEEEESAVSEAVREAVARSSRVVARVVRPVESSDEDTESEEEEELRAPRARAAGAQRARVVIDLVSSEDDEADSLADVMALWGEEVARGGWALPADMEAALRRLMDYPGKFDRRFTESVAADMLALFEKEGPEAYISYVNEYPEILFAFDVAHVHKTNPAFVEMLRQRQEVHFSSQLIDAHTPFSEYVIAEAYLLGTWPWRTESGAFALQPTMLDGLDPALLRAFFRRFGEISETTRMRVSLQIVNDRDREVEKSVAAAVREVTAGLA